jgi:hypothetical protein
MPARTVLTKEVVNKASAPDKGERWIADTRIPGFGLRVWRNGSGEVGRAFGVRVRATDGQIHRKTFNVWDNLGSYYLYRRYRYEDLTLGDLIEEARRWAEDSIDTLKGRTTLTEESEANRKSFGDVLGNIPLGRAMEAYLAGRRADGLTEAYLDRLDKLFVTFVSADTRALPIADVTSEMLLSSLSSPRLSTGNLRVLRPLLKGLFSRYRSMHWGRNVAADAAELIKGHSSDWPMPAEGLPAWPEARFTDFFEWLGEQEQYWQQGLCLSLFIRIYNVPLTRTMSARWDQFFMVEVGSWPSSHQKESRPAWYWDVRPWRRHIFRSSDDRLVSKLLERQSPTSQFLFPSPYGRSVEHIRTVDHIWIAALAEFGLPYTSPIKFRSHYHALNLAGGWWHKDVF